MTPRTPLSKDTIVEDQNHRKVLDGLHLVFVELPKFRPETLAEKKMQVLWLRFLTEIDENTRRVPQELLDDPHVNEALEIVEESAYTPGEMRAYDKFWDRMSLIATAARTGRRGTIPRRSGALPSAHDLHPANTGTETKLVLSQCWG